MPGLRPFSFSAGERKIMNHSVVNIFLSWKSKNYSDTSQIIGFVGLPQTVD
jgi:hypothetical protein